MAYNYKPSQKLLVCLTNGDIFEGIYQNGSKDRVDLLDSYEHPSGSKIPGLLSFYRNEIKSITLLEPETVDGDVEDDGNKAHNGNDCKNKILLVKAEYERLKDMSK